MIDDSFIPTSDVEMTARQYLQFRKGREQLQKNEDTLKKALLETLSEEETDSSGHSYLRFPEPVDGVEGFKRERRVSQIMDEDLAMKMITAYGLEDTCLETVQIINEDGLLAANFSGIIPDEAMQDLYIETESYAFVLLKEKKSS